MTICVRSAEPTSACPVQSTRSPFSSSGASLALLAGATKPRGQSRVTAAAAARLRFDIGVRPVTVLLVVGRSPGRKVQRRLSREPAAVVRLPRSTGVPFGMITVGFTLAIE